MKIWEWHKHQWQPVLYQEGRDNGCSVVVVGFQCVDDCPKRKQKTYWDTNIRLLKFMLEGKTP